MGRRSSLAERKTLRTLALAIEVLSLVEHGESDLRATVEKVSQQMNVKVEASIREARRLAYETVDRKNLIDTIIKELVTTARFDDLSPGAQAFLRIFIYLTNISQQRIEPVDLAKQGRRILGWDELMPVEQALGRSTSLDTEKVRVCYRDDEALALRTLSPLWFVRYLIRIFGRMEALRILSARTRSQRLVRLNIRGTSASEREILTELENRGLTLKKRDGLPNVYTILKGEDNLRREIKAGLLRLQDLPSILAMVACAPEAGSDVLFTSAVPAAAATYLAQLMGDVGSVTVRDDSEGRLARVREDASRAKISIVRTELVGDVASPPGRKMKIVVIHAPNSRTGVFWREPSLKWRSYIGTVEYFTSVQSKLLEAFSKSVRAGGRLVYWTRSVGVEENELAIERFLLKYPEFTLSDTRPKVGVPGLRGQSQSQRLFPHLHSCDGSYVAILEKSEASC